jgi:hypothetical protein
MSRPVTMMTSEEAQRIGEWFDRIVMLTLLGVVVWIFFYADLATLAGVMQNATADQSETLKDIKVQVTALEVMTCK